MDRHRENDGRFSECGSYYAFGGLQDFACITHGPFESCDDTVGNLDTSNVFNLLRTFTHFPTSTGIVGPRELIGYPIQYHPGPDDPRSMFPAFSNADMNSLAWEILAKTNPSVPSVNIPAYLGELKDIPGSTRDFGRSLLRSVAAGYITWRWAVKPLVKDLANLYNFQKSVNNRMRLLYLLRDGRTLRRRCNLSRTSSSYINNVQLNNIVYFLNGTRRVVGRQETWGTAEWKLLPDSKLPTMGYNALFDKAWQSTSGIDSYGALAAAWELTPWSWLVDWFSNVGTCINASNNSLGLTFGRISLMRTSTTKSEYVASGSPPSTITLSGWYIEEAERKERYPVFPVIPVPLPTLPLLTSRQLSILGALAVLKGTKP